MSMDNLFSGLDAKEAEISPCGCYRYTLTREWADGECVTWLMFNPSTADAMIDDHTITKCIAFSKQWGYGRMVVVNLYAIRSRDPKALKKMPDAQAVGALNNFWTVEACKESREVICAWGCSEHAPGITDRIWAVLALLDEHCFSTPIMCLGSRKDGHPRHPLMLPYSTPREQFFLPEVQLSK